MSDATSTSAALRRARAFLISNGTSALSILPYLKLSPEKDGFDRWWAATVFRLGFICAVLGIFARKRLDEDRLKGKEQEPGTIEMILRLVLVASPLESLMTSYALKRFCNKASENASWLWFVPKSFLFEILMDFGHYCAHRFMHTNAFIYTWSGHKAHHTVHKPTVLATFNQHPIDVLLSNVIPVLGSLWVLEKLGVRFSKAQLLMAMGLKTYVEVAGHVGVLDTHATSFPQCVWLPRAFGIELHTRDHDLHHTHGGKHNFSKRFTLFDKLFNTYRDATVEDR